MHKATSSNAPNHHCMKHGMSDCLQLTKSPKYCLNPGTKRHCLSTPRAPDRSSHSRPPRLASDIPCTLPKHQPNRRISYFIKPIYYPTRHNIPHTRHTRHPHVHRTHTPHPTTLPIPPSVPPSIQPSPYICHSQYSAHNT